MNTKSFTTGKSLLFVVVIIIVGLYVVLNVPRRTDSSLYQERGINGEVRSFDEPGDIIVTPPDSKETMVIEDEQNGNLRITTKNGCEANTGVWYEGSNVCEINSLSTEAMCTSRGGEWNECASACRHDPKAEMCTMQCVMTCSFR